MKHFYIAYELTNDKGQVYKVEKIAVPVFEDTVNLTILNVSPEIYSVMNTVLNRADNLGIYWKPNMGKSKALNIMCLNTGETFTSLSAAARKNGGTVAALSRHVNGKAGNKSVNGFVYALIPDNRPPIERF